MSFQLVRRKVHGRMKIRNRVFNFGFYLYRIRRTPA